MIFRNVVTEPVEKWLEEEEAVEGAMIADGYNDCIIGCIPEKRILVYDRDAIIEKLAKGSPSWETEPDEAYQEAVEFFEYNISGAYVGENTPLYVSLLKFEPISQGA